MSPSKWLVFIRPSLAGFDRPLTALGKMLGGKVTISDIAAKDEGLGAREAKRLAERIAAQLEDASRQARMGRFTEQQARSVVADIFSIANKDELPSSTIKEFFHSWLKRKELEANERTYDRYKTAIEHVLDYLGGRANRDIAHLSAKEITGIRDHLAKQLSPNSANYTVKVLRAALNQARRDGLVVTNEASRMTLIQRPKRVERRPFTLDELRRILAVASPEWKGMILVGLYTGLRLGDIASLTWANIDLQQKELRVQTEKTGRQQILPLIEPLLQHIQGLPVGDDPTAPLFPQAFACKQRNPNVGLLSNQFYNILVAVGLVPKRSHEKKADGPGRGGARKLNEISFHCLRHTATSLLKNAGVSDVIARDIIGHDSVAVSRNYTHIDGATKRAALQKMPDIFRPEST